MQGLISPLGSVKIAGIVAGRADLCTVGLQINFAGCLKLPGFKGIPARPRNEFMDRKDKRAFLTDSFGDMLIGLKTFHLFLSEL